MNPPADYERLREHIRGAIKLLYPEEMTPHAKRMLERILDQNDEWVRARNDGGECDFHGTDWRSLCRQCQALRPQQSNGEEVRDG